MVHLDWVTPFRVPAQTKDEPTPHKEASHPISVALVRRIPVT